MAEQDPVLSLQTVTTYQWIEIDSSRYRLLPPDSFSLFDRIDLEALEERIGGILTADTRTPKQEEEVSRLLDQLCRRVLEAPVGVHKKLSDSHRMMIAEAFIRLPRSGRRPTEAAGKTAPRVEKRARGAKASRDSHGSTAAVRSSGTPASRSVSSKPAA